MEGLVMSFFGESFRNRRVLLADQTGFKRSWLGPWLKTLGAEVTSLYFTHNSITSHCTLLNLDNTRAYQGLEWYKANLNNKTVISEKRIRGYPAATKQVGLVWGYK
jgi:hypothetical protein